MTLHNLSEQRDKRPYAICESCSAPIVRGGGGPPARWCATCRVERNKETARRRRASAGARPRAGSVVAGTRNSRADWQLPAEDHLAIRVVRMRLAINEATALLVAAGVGGVPLSPLAVAANKALEVLASVPVGR